MYKIGVDLGGTNIAAGLVNESYELIAKKSVPTGAHREAECVLADMVRVCRELCEENGVPFEEIEGIGIASPGVVDGVAGVVKYANNLRFSEVPVADYFRRNLGVQRIFAENDANAAALGEAVAGAAKGVAISAMITLGTGVGGGIIIDGKVYAGFNFAAPELGHMVIEYNGRPCSCGRRGCWEAYSSATALIRMTAEKLEECRTTGRETLMTALVEEKGKISGRTAFDAERAGDAAAAEVVECYLGYLACGLANIINAIQPDVLSIGGGVSGEGQSLLDRLIPMVRKEQYGVDYVKLTEIRIAQLGNDAGVIGAAALVR